MPRIVQSAGWFVAGRPSAVLHLPRDLRRTASQEGQAADSVLLVDALRELLPEVDVHVVTTAGPTGHAGAGRPKSAAALEALRRREAAFDAYRRRGVALHLDADPQVAWAHFATATVFVMGLSAFSAAAAALNPRCVVYPTVGAGAEAFPYARQPGWATSAELQGGDGPELLRACMGSLRSVSGLNVWTARLE